MLDEYPSGAAKEGKETELKRVDEILYASLSELSAVYQMLDMVQIHRPRAQKVSFDEAEKLKTAGSRTWRYMEDGYLDDCGTLRP